MGIGATSCRGLSAYRLEDIIKWGNMDMDSMEKLKSEYCDCRSFGGMLWVIFLRIC